MRCTILSWACLSLLVPTGAPAQDTDLALASAVRISGTRSETPVRGSGFVVAVDRGVATVVTASHVIEGARFEVQFAAAATTRFEVDAADVLGMESGDPNGLAVFQVRGAIPDVPALAFNVESRPQAAESLLLIGFPQRSRTPLAKRRTYSARRGNLLLLDLPVGEGFSGGPVLRDGKVVGVVTGEDLQLTYAVNAVVVREFVAGSAVALGGQALPAEPETDPEGPAISDPAKIDNASATRTSSIAVAVVDPYGRADLSAAIDLAARLAESGYAATTLDVGGTELRALLHGKIKKLRLPAGVDHVLLAELGETTLVNNPDLLDIKTARLDLGVKIFTANTNGRPIAAFDAGQAGASSFEDRAVSEARRRAFEELVLQVRDRLP